MRLLGTKRLRATELTGRLDQTQINEIICADPPAQVGWPSRDIDPVRLGVDGTYLHDLKWINILSRPRRIACGKAVEHSSSSLYGFVAKASEVLRTDCVSLVVDADLAGGQWQANNCGAMR